jgi:hypothetical protein
MHLGGAHQTGRERARLDQRGSLRRAEATRDRDRLGEPRPTALAARNGILDGVARVGCQRAISPRIAELGGKFGMQIEAAPRQWIERGAATPVERQEAAGLAGGRACDLVTLDDDRPRATPACEIGDRSADRAAAADHDALARSHSAYRHCRTGGRPSDHRSQRSRAVATLHRQCLLGARFRGMTSKKIAGPRDRRPWSRSAMLPLVCPVLAFIAIQSMRP